MGIKSRHLPAVLKYRKKHPELTISQAVRALQRKGELDGYTEPKTVPMIPVNRIRTLLNKKGMRVSAGAAEALQREVNIILDVAVKLARQDCRKTVKACDIRGETVGL